MPDTQHEEPMPSPRRRLDAEEFAAELLNEMQEGRKAFHEEFREFRREMVSELRDNRKAQGRRDTFFSVGTLVLVLVLVYGILEMRGVDTSKVADATAKTGHLIPGTSSTTTTTTTGPGVTTETVTAPPGSPEPEPEPEPIVPEEEL